MKTEEVACLLFSRERWGCVALVVTGLCWDHAVRGRKGEGCDILIAAALSGLGLDAGFEYMSSPIMLCVVLEGACIRSGGKGMLYDSPRTPCFSVFLSFGRLSLNALSRGGCRVVLRGD